MTTTDYFLDIALIAIVFRQIRESRLDLRAVLLPIGICVWVGAGYLKSLPTAGNDLLLIGALSAVGVSLGVLSGLATRVRRNAEGHALIKAGWVAAGAWVLGMGFRFGFALWAAHGGGPGLVRFSAAHAITGDDAWTDALVLMAFGEVFTRTAILVLRARITARPAEAAAKQLVTV